ncbi:MAG: ribosome biogenesis GTP-binding protein YihA/YsxC [Desulfobacterales bacterium]|jgi:GTP-binding protein
MIIKSAEFIKSAVKASHYPPARLPEIVFAGRSNVGKSSLINSLVNRKRLAKTSSTPGRTQLINFFEINAEFVFVDIPGFGYAKVPIAIRRSWAPMIETYLTTRRTLKGLVLILDSRRTPGLEELALVGWLNRHQIATVMALTKIDKLSRSRQLVCSRSTAAALAVPQGDIVLFSAKTRQGREELWQRIEGLLVSDK